MCAIACALAGTDDGVEDARRARAGKRPKPTAIRVSTSRNGGIDVEPSGGRVGADAVGEVAGHVDHDVGDREQVEVDAPVRAERHDDQVGADVAARRWC